MAPAPRGPVGVRHIAGGDPGRYRLDDLDSAERVPLVIDCVRDLTGSFDAARRDLR